MPNEDAVDIIANTFLSCVTEEQIAEIGLGFLKHRHRKYLLQTVRYYNINKQHTVRIVIMGHLAWTGQNASGNRGDDFRALKFSEMQPYVWLHPNKETAVESVLGLQGEEKAGRKGLKTVRS